MRKTCTLALVFCLALSACGSPKSTPPPEVSGAKTAVALMNILLQKQNTARRPGGTLGIFSTLFTSQGIFLPVKSATLGFDAMRKIMEGITKPDTDENYALLQEAGSTLQLNVIDTLNRSDNRKETVESIAQSLHNISSLLDRKITELTSTGKELQKTQKEQQKTVTEVQRAIQKAMKDEDYSTAGSKQEELQKAQSDLASTQSKNKQVADLLSRFKVLLNIAVQRTQAIEANREILIAGLKVVDVPGISDLGILQTGKSYKAKGGVIKP